VGHPLGYIGTDVYGRFRRMKGDNVLHAMGYDAFGLPPSSSPSTPARTPRRTDENVATTAGSFAGSGWPTTPPVDRDDRRDYYRWTQWIFLQIFDSWYDADAGPGRPVSELVAELDSGSRTPADGTTGHPCPSSIAVATSTSTDSAT
jgi:leucyl-tRNA synthetase